MDSLESPFDTLVIGTGVSQSIVAAALARAGHRVLHVDDNDYYGSRHASLTLTELIEWISIQKLQPSGPYSSMTYRFPGAVGDQSTCPAPLLANSRQYCMSLSPSLVPSTGDLIDALVKSGVSRYGSFRLLDAVGVVQYAKGGEAQTPTLRPVPSSKEDVFKDRELSLLTKRKLMKLLQFALGDYEDTEEWRGRGEKSALEFINDRFGVSSDVASAVIFAIAGSPTASEPASSTFARLRRYMRSAGRYGNSPFLMGHFGGLGEIAQGFCRSCAVHGGTYILGRTLQSLTPVNPSDGSTNASPARFSVVIDGIDTPLLAATVLCPRTSSAGNDANVSNTTVVRGIVLIDRPSRIADALAPETESGEQTGDGIDTISVVFPPGCLSAAATDTFSVSCLITGNGTMSAPRDKSIVYLCATRPQKEGRSAEALLRPYLDALLALTTEAGSVEQHTPLFELFYFESSEPHVATKSGIYSPKPSDTPSPGYFAFDDAAPAVATLAETADLAASRATALFWDISKLLAQDSGTPVPEVMWTAEGGDSGDADDAWE